MRLQEIKIEDTQIDDLRHCTYKIDPSKGTIKIELFESNTFVLSYQETFKSTKELLSHVYNISQHGPKDYLPI